MFSNHNGRRRYKPQNRRYNHNYKSSQPYKLLVAGGIFLAIAASGIYFFNKNDDKVEIISLTPNIITIQKSYQDCKKVNTITYSNNHKNGKEGAIIGGATGAVAGGIVANQIRTGGGATAVGAIVGGATGALIGREIQRSNQPNYIAHTTHSTKCYTVYKPLQQQYGYNIKYLYKNNLLSTIIQSPLTVGMKIPLVQLQQMLLPPKS